MMYSEAQVKQIAKDYKDYFASVIDTQPYEQPLDINEWFESYSPRLIDNVEKNIDLIIHYLNTTCQLYSKRGFMLKGKKIRSLIRTKLKEGFTVDNFFDVIETKIYWLEDKSMHKYYRPITLFGNKFEDYLNETTKPLDKNSDEQFTEAVNKAATDTY